MNLVDIFPSEKGSIMPPVSPKGTMFWVDQVGVNRIRITWKIGGITDKYSWQGSASPEFSGEDERIAWALVIYPYRGILELQLRDCANKVSGRCKLSALNSNNKEVKILKRSFKELSSEQSVSFKDFLTKDLSVKGVEGSLKDHQVTLFCEITIAKEHDSRAKNSSCIVI